MPTERPPLLGEVVPTFADRGETIYKTTGRQILEVRTLHEIKFNRQPARRIDPLPPRNSVSFTAHRPESPYSLPIVSVLLSRWKIEKHDMLGPFIFIEYDIIYLHLSSDEANWWIAVAHVGLRNLEWERSEKQFQILYATWFIWRNVLTSRLGPLRWPFSPYIKKVYVK
jgi:hypothetical protein